MGRYDHPPIHLDIKEPDVLTDIEIAQAATPKRIDEIAEKIGIPDSYLEMYGKYKAKVDYN